MAQLDPAWILVRQNRLGGRHFRVGVGVIFDCPTHPWRCRLEFYFSHPDDGGAPALDMDGHTRLYGHSCVSNRPAFDTLTLWTDLPAPERGMLLEKPHHWTGYVREGVVYDALATDD